MNRHFQDARYYLKRTVVTAKKGVATELKPVTQRFKKATGETVEHESGRVEKVKREAKNAAAAVRRRVDAYRQTRA